MVLEAPLENEKQRSPVFDRYFQIDLFLTSVGLVDLQRLKSVSRIAWLGDMVAGDDHADRLFVPAPCTVLNLAVQ